MESWIAESDFLFRDSRVPRQQPSTRLQALAGENQNASAAGLPQRQHLFHLGQDPGLNWESIQWKWPRCLCALDEVTLSGSPASDTFDLVAEYYNFDKELLHADQLLLYWFKKTHVEKSIAGFQCHAIQNISK